MKKILVVDDSATSRALFRAFIPEMYDCEVYEASNCSEALKLAQEIKPNLCVMDYNLPGKNGIEITRAIIDSKVDTSFVLMTANTQESILDEAKGLGFIGVIEKPIDREKIEKLIKQVCSEDISPFSRKQVDALLELTNVGFSRAAKHLSNKLNDRIDLSIPEISILSTEEMHQYVGAMNDKELRCVYQDVNGILSGRILFLIYGKDCGDICHMMRNHSNSESMKELGSLIIGTAVDIMSMMLDEKVQLTSPHYETVPLENICELFTKADGNHNPLSVIITTLISAESKDITGRLILNSSLDSLRALAQRIEDMVRKA